MKGSANIIDALNTVLTQELTAINQYFLHARMFQNWGLEKIGKLEYEASIDEMKHADQVIKRILFLEGLPNLQRLNKIRVGQTVPEVIQADLEVEYEAVPNLKKFIKLCEELFSAATSEFKNLEFFYFHNCPYEGVWKDNKRRFSERTPMWDVLHKFPHDYKVVMVGDASMSPYEITHPGGSVEHFNEESGAVWMNRITNTYPATVWLNPVPEKQWGYSQSTKIIKELMNDRMYPLTLEGLDDAMRELSRKHSH